MQKFCRYGEFSEYVLARTTEIVKSYILKGDHSFKEKNSKIHLKKLNAD